jgi:hypothetical protein
MDQLPSREIVRREKEERDGKGDGGGGDLSFVRQSKPQQNLSFKVPELSLLCPSASCRQLLAFFI